MSLRMVTPSSPSRAANLAASRRVPAMAQQASWPDPARGPRRRTRRRRRGASAGAAATRAPPWRADGFLQLRGRAGAASARAAPGRAGGRLSPTPARSRARSSRLGAGRGAEAEVRQQARRADDAELSGLAGGERQRRRRRPHAGAPHARRRAPTSASSRRDAGFNLYLPHAGSTDAEPAGTRALRADHRRGGGQARRRSGCRDRAVGLERRSERGQIKDDFADPAIARGRGRKGGLVFANGAAAPLKLSARPRRARAAAARQRGDRAAGDRRHRRARKPLIVAVDGQPSEPFEPLRNQFPMGPGARFELMFDMPRDAERRRPLRPARRGGRSRPCRSSPSRPRASRSPPRSAPPRLAANPLLPAEIALEAARRCDFAIIGRRRGAVRGQRRDFRRLVGEAGLSRSRAARRPCSRSPTRRRSCRRCASAAMSRGSCTRWTTAGSPIGATPSSSSPAARAHIAFVADNPGKWPIEFGDPRASRRRRRRVVSGGLTLRSRDPSRAKPAKAKPNPGQEKG